MAFWDASALVPLCVNEATSRSSHAYLGKFAPVVWWGSLVEVHSAIFRLHKGKEITDAGMKGALARLRRLSEEWKEILPGDAIRELAVRLLSEHSLRAADSLQPAASLTWCRQRPSRRNFICADHKLAQAVHLAGFSVVLLSGSAVQA